MSPATGDINWGMVLWHELGHVFAIQLSNSRVPRWFTEGLQRVRDADRAARVAARERRRPLRRGRERHAAVDRRPQLRVHAARPATRSSSRTSRSAVTIEYLAQTYGFPKIVEALKLYGKGKETPEVLAGDHRQDDRAARHRLPQVPRHPARRRTRARSSCRRAASTTSPSSRSPPTPRRRTRSAKRERRARLLLRAATPTRPAPPRRPRSRSIRSSRSRATSWPRSRCTTSDADKAKQLYAGLVADGHDSYDLRTRLAQIAQRGRRRSAEVEKQLCAAKKLDPERSYPYQALAEHLQEAGRRSRARSPSSSTTRSSSRWSSRRSRS